MKRINLRRIGPFLLAAAVACTDTGGGGCGGCDGTTPPYPDPPPPGGEIIDHVARVRVTQGMLDFLTDHVSLLMSQALTPVGDQLRFEIGSDLVSSSTLQLREGSYLAFDSNNLRESLQLEWVPDNLTGEPGLRVSINKAQLYLDMVMSVTTDIFPPAACRLYDGGVIPALTVNEISFIVRFKVDNSTGVPLLMARVEGQPLEEGGMAPPGEEQPVFRLGSFVDETILSFRAIPCDGTSVAPAPECVDPTCSVVDANCPEMCGLLDIIFSELGGFLVQVLDPVFEAMGPQIAGFLSDALVSSFSGIPLGGGTALDVGALAGGMFPAAEPIAIQLLASTGASIRGSGAGEGLELGLSGGFSAFQPSLCAQVGTPPDIESLRGPPPDFTGFVEIDDGTGTHFERYHIGFAASEAMLAQAMWGLYQGGLLCFSLGSEDVAALAGDAFVLNAGLLADFDPSVGRLVENPNSPVLLTIQATEPPSIRLGQGGLVDAGITDPSLEIAINDLLLGVHLQLDETMWQVAELNIDFVLPIFLSRAPDSQLDITIDDVRYADLYEIHNELAPGSDIPGLIGVILDLALGQVLADGFSSTVSLAFPADSAFGVPVDIRVNTIRRDLGPDGSHHLAVYMTMCDEEGMANPENGACYTPGYVPGTPRAFQLTAPRLAIADPTSLYLPADPSLWPAERWTAVPSGRAVLSVASDATAATQLEYQYRVDNGLWKPFRPLASDSTLEITSPRLRLVGYHTVEVRARTPGDPNSRVACEPLQFWVDPERPTVDVTRVSDSLYVDVYDRGSGEATQIFTRQRAGDSIGSWRPAASVIDVSGMQGVIEVIARDMAGNSSVVVPVTLTDIAPAAVADTAVIDPTASHSAVRSGCGAVAPSLLGLLAVVPLSRRRRRSKTVK